MQVEKCASDVFSWITKVKGSQAMKNLLEDAGYSVCCLRALAFVNVSPTDAKVDIE